MRLIIEPWDLNTAQISSFLINFIIKWIVIGRQLLTQPTTIGIVFSFTLMRHQMIEVLFMKPTEYFYCAIYLFFPLCNV
jgi:hypothetical protein